MLLMIRHVGMLLFSLYQLLSEEIGVVLTQAHARDLDAADSDENQQRKVGLYVIVKLKISRLKRIFKAESLWSKRWLGLAPIRDI
jgi:hypothetical protein